MKKNKAKIIAAALALVALTFVLLTRGDALAEGAGTADKIPFAMSLILLIVDAVLLIATFLPRRENTDIRKLTMAAMFAALCYVGFAVFKIDIPVGTEKTAFHFGNVFVVLGALFLGGLWGGLAGAVGLTVADLTTGYITSAPKTFLLKLLIGVISGLVAHKVFHIGRAKEERRVSLPLATVLSAAAGMLFNTIADPIVGYFNKMYVWGVPQDAANIWVKIGALTTLVNSVTSVIAATILYLALRPALEKTRLMPKI